MHDPYDNTGDELGLQPSTSWVIQLEQINNLSLSYPNSGPKLRETAMKFVGNGIWLFILTTIFWCPIVTPASATTNATECKAISVIDLSVALIQTEDT